MISIFSLLANSSVYDNFGVEFSDKTYKRLVLAPASLLQYEIPEETETISGGNKAGDEKYSAFYLCRSNLQQLTFHERSMLKLIEPYGFYGFTQLKVINMSTCRNLTVISTGAFQSGTSITQIILPPNIEEISKGAFYRMTSLTEINFPSSLKIIGDYSDYLSSFGHCTSLFNISFEETPSIKKIGTAAFEVCNISKFHIPLTLESINGWSFKQTPLSSITVDESHKCFSLYKGCLYNKNFSEIILVPYSFDGTYITHNNTKVIGLASFINSQFQKIILSNEVETICSRAFQGSLAQEISIPRTVKTIESIAFFKCAQLQTIDVNVSISSIEQETFSECTSLNKVILSSRIQSIGVKAFAYCSSLDFLFIPKSVTELGSGCFSAINKTADVEFEEGSPFKYENKYIYDSNFTTIYSYIGDETGFTATIKSSVKYIGELSFFKIGVKYVNFEGTSSLEELLPQCFRESTIERIKLPSSLKRIRYYSFFLCNKLSQVTFDNSLSTIEYGSFASTEITQLFFPESLEYIGAGAFDSCKKLSIVAFEGDSKLREIESNCFKRTGIIQIEIPPNIQALGSTIFMDSSLTFLSFKSPSKLEYISDFAFKGCNKLKSIMFAEGNKIIGRSCFEDCDSLETLELGSSIENISMHAMKGCFALKSVSIPLRSSLSVIENQAFINCPNLLQFNVSSENPSFSTDEGILYDKKRTRIVLYLPANPQEYFKVPTTVSTISIFGFQDAANLKVIELTESIRSIEYGAFIDCKNLIHINIPNSIENIGRMAFSGCNNMKCSSIEYDMKYRENLILAGASLESLAVCTTICFSAETQNNFNWFAIFIVLMSE